MAPRPLNTESNNRKNFKIALISMPWPIFNRPSIQLGVLKAYLEREADWLAVDTFHPYLEVAAKLGIDLYHAVSQKWASEALYGALLFPENHEKAKKYFSRVLQRTDTAAARSFDRITGILQDQLDSWVSSHDWRQYRLLGFSVCFNQLLASLAAAKKLKSLFPDLPIVFGGSTCAQDMGASLFCLEEIDYLVSGEGELPLLKLCEFLARKNNDLSPGILARGNSTSSFCQTCSKDTSHSSQINDMSLLPVPDYRDYFKEMRLCFSNDPFIPTIPIEFSRGCWWRKCTFCNLNLQWRGYRAKKPEQMANEVLSLSQQHGSLDFTFADNALPQRHSISFFENIAESGQDFSFFGEIRATDNIKHLAAYKKGGLNTVQVGIESLSNSLLKKIKKGVSVIDNIAAMKSALECSITLEGNLITEFPGSSPAEIDETLVNLDFVLPYPPLSIATFFLGHGSPVDLNYKDFGIRSVNHHQLSSRIFPKPLLKQLILPVMDYRGDRLNQRKLWQPVVSKVKAWNDFHRQALRNGRPRPLLSYRNGGDYIIIRQVRPEGRTLHHRLYNSSRLIYLFCYSIRSAEEIQERFKNIQQKKLFAFMADLVRKRLLFADSGKYLSLAIRDGKLSKAEA